MIFFQELDTVMRPFHVVKIWEKHSIGVNPWRGKQLSSGTVNPSPMPMFLHWSGISAAILSMRSVSSGSLFRAAAGVG